MEDARAPHDEQEGANVGNWTDRIASAGARLLLRDRHLPIGGHAYDCYDEAAILIHKYAARSFLERLLERLEYSTRFLRWQGTKRLQPA